MDAGAAVVFAALFWAPVSGFSVPFVAAAVDEAATEDLDFAVEVFLAVFAIPVFLVVFDFAVAVVDFALVVVDFAPVATVFDLVAALVAFFAVEVVFL